MAMRSSASSLTNFRRSIDQHFDRQDSRARFSLGAPVQGPPGHPVREAPWQ
jgi:hypothetical protein